MDWSWKGSLSGQIYPRHGHDWWWQALGMDKAFWKRNAIILLYATIHLPFLPSSWFSGKSSYMKGNDHIGDTPIFSTEKTMIMGERVAFSRSKQCIPTAEETWGTPLSTKRRWVFFPLKLRWNPDTMTRSLVTRYFGEVVRVEKGPKNDRELRR